MTAARLASLDWELIPYTPHTAHMHVALDEVLLQRVIAGRRRPTVRFWEWTERALVIGSHQSVINEIDTATAQQLGFTVTRRMSGGGTMLCEPGRTVPYSLYVPAKVVDEVSLRQLDTAPDPCAERPFGTIGVPVGYRDKTAIISPSGIIAR